jgi:hypothetical protein
MMGDVPRLLAMAVVAFGALGALGCGEVKAGYGVDAGQIDAAASNLRVDAGPDGPIGLPDAGPPADASHLPDAEVVPDGVVCDPKRGQSCGTCGGVYLCNGTCNLTDPPDLGSACGSCGTIQCNGTCSPGDPPDLGTSCGSCGKIQCNETCSPADPSNLGASCGGGVCGGKIRCDGSCSFTDPSSLGASCAAGTCGGKVQCDGSCLSTDPSNLGAACGSCGGKVQCDGSCSVATPADYGTSCSPSCGGTVQCDESCSAATDAGDSCGSIHCSCGVDLPKQYDCAGVCVPADGLTCADVCCPLC